MVLDRQLPDGDGLSPIPEVARQRKYRASVLVVTARGDLADRVAGLDKGADDYLAKPFAFEELLARLRALFASTGQPTVRYRARVGRISFDFTHREASIEEDLWKRSAPRTTRIGSVGAPPHGTHGATIIPMEAVFGLDDEVQPNALDTHISRLRRKSEMRTPEDDQRRSRVGYLRETPTVLRPRPQVALVGRLVVLQATMLTLLSSCSFCWSWRHCGVAVFWVMTMKAAPLMFSKVRQNGTLEAD